MQCIDWRGSLGMRSYSLIRVTLSQRTARLLLPNFYAGETSYRFRL